MKIQGNRRFEAKQRAMGTESPGRSSGLSIVGGSNWAAPLDVFELSRLSTVLKISPLVNLLASTRVPELSESVRDGSYRVDAFALSQRLVANSLS